MPRAREEDFESKSGSENIEVASGDDQDQSHRPRKKRYHRHTQHQIQELEAFFKECPHPDDKQRKELSRELGLEPLQNHHERHENNQLRAENEKLRAENVRYKEALTNASCPNCGGPAALGEMSFDEHHLRIENARLREEIDRISGIAAKYVGKPVVSYPLPSPAISSRSPLDVGVGAEMKSMLKLAERMVISFCGGVSASTTHQWTTLSGSGAEDVRVMTRKSVDDPGRPPGIVLNAATSFWLPVPPKRVFDFLRDEGYRSEVLETHGLVFSSHRCHVS
ncbi:hypothetical protein B296_00043237 [Ensete ventricosum]|uniref:Homeobox domain-containing protein n=1 Tax=Ensete ventricosum TaxID=4639 RepID=A0A426ZFG5_ENSVE|nr:hypothetical protein B296_00043237 [Ensete ventricosum]